MLFSENNCYLAVILFIDNTSCVWHQLALWIKPVTLTPDSIVFICEMRSLIYVSDSRKETLSNQKYYPLTKSLEQYIST